MAATEPGEITMEDFGTLARRAGLELTLEELEQMKPTYDLYADMIRLVHSVDLDAEESGVTFRPDWTSP